MTTTPIVNTNTSAQSQPLQAGETENIQKKKKRIKPKWGKNAISCAAIFMAFILILVLFLAFAIAKTGLIKIPIFSRFYNGPTPTRLVQGDRITWDEFRIVVAGRIFEQREYKTDVYTIQVNEQEITGLLTSTIDSALRNSEWKPIITQIAINPTGMETLLKFSWKSRINMDLMFVFIPTVDDDGNIDFDIKKTQFGDYPLPASWGKSIAGLVLSRDLGLWELKISGEKAVKSVSLLEKAMNVILFK